MDKKYFEENVLKCKVCGSTPTMARMSKGSVFSLTEDCNDVKYCVICEECEFEDGSGSQRTGLCKTPENALKAWNKKMKVE